MDRKFVCFLVVLLVALAVTQVESERPKVPLLTPKPAKPTSVEIQVQLIEHRLDKHSYANCFGHVVRLKLKDGPKDFELVPIVEKEGGFLLEGLEPETDYNLVVACKTNSVPAHVGDWTDPIRVTTPAMPKGGDHEDKKALPWDLPLPAPLQLVQTMEGSPNPNSSYLPFPPSPDEVFGVLGEYVRMRCESSKLASDPPIPLEWIYRNKTLESSREFKISNYGNSSELRVYLKSKTRFRDYKCQLRINGTYAEVIRAFNLLEGKKPPKFKLIAEWVQMKSAKFRTELIDEGNVDPYLLGHVVYFKKVCHNVGPWQEANITEHENGFTIKELRPNESYCLKVALKNKASIGSFDSYWSIHTSSACLLKSEGLRPTWNPVLFCTLSLFGFTTLYLVL